MAQVILRDPVLELSLKRFLPLAVIFLIPFATIAQAQQMAPPDLERERVRIQAEIDDATKASNAYDGGVIKALISSRLEVLKLSLALVDQRRIAGAGAKTEVTIPAAAPDAARAAKLEQEIRVLDGKLAATEMEAQGSGGLVKLMVESRAATERLSITMLQTELLKAKYGIAWMPSATNPPLAAAPSMPVATDRDEAPRELPKAAQMIVPTVSNKRFRPADASAQMYQDLLAFDVALSTAALPAPTRSIKGQLVFADLFGDVQYRIEWTINEKLTPGKVHNEKGLSVKYNQFFEGLTWLRGTDLNDMRIWFEIKDVIYQDGKRETFQ